MEKVLIEGNATEGGFLSRRAALGLGAAAWLAGCARVRDPNRLSFWAMSTEGENAPLLMPAFTRESGIHVDVQSLPWTAAHEKVLTAYAGGSLPDVLMVANSWIPELVAIGALAPLPGAGPSLTDDQFPGALNAMRVGGRPHGVPWIVDTQVQYYRRDLLAREGHAVPPPRWDEWKALGHALKRRRPESYAVLLLLDWPEQLMHFAAQQPEPLLRDHSARGNFTTPGFRTALAFYKSIFDEGLAPPIVGTEIGDSLTAFRQGYFALLPSDTKTVGDLRLRAGDIPRTLWSVAEMPGPHGPARGLTLGMSLVVTSTARDPTRAWSLVRYLCRPDTQLNLYAITGDLPSRPSAWTAPQLVRSDTARVFAAQLARGTPEPSVPEWARIRTEIQLIAERMVRGQFGVDAAAAEMNTRADKLLEKRRWLLDRGLAT